MLLCCVTLYNFYFDSFALSTERTWFDLHFTSDTYVTNKETLNFIIISINSSVFQLSLYSHGILLLSSVLHYKKIMEYFVLKSDEIKAVQQILP